MKNRNLFSVAAVSVRTLSLADDIAARGGDTKGKKLDANSEDVSAQSEPISQRQKIFRKPDADVNGSVTQAKMKAAQEAKPAERRDPATLWQKVLKCLDANQA